MGDLCKFSLGSSPALAEGVSAEVGATPFHPRGYSLAFMLDAVCLAGHFLASSRVLAKWKLGSPCDGIFSSCWTARRGSLVILTTPIHVSQFLESTSPFSKVVVVLVLVGGRGGERAQGAGI